MRLGLNGFQMIFYYAIEGEREREKEKYVFALLMAQNASNEKTRVLAGEKKVKGLVFGEGWEYGGETSCVYGDSI